MNPIKDGYDEFIGFHKSWGKWTTQANDTD